MSHKNMLQKVLGTTLFLTLMLGCGLLTSAPISVPSTEEPTTASPMEEPTLVPPTKKPTRIPPTPTPEPANQYKDEHVTIVFEQTERMQELPEDFEGPPAGAGKEYLVLYMTVKEIRDVHITNMLGSKDNRPTIKVISGEEYSTVTGRVTGVKFSDPTNITGPSELVEGAECTLVFEVPTGVQLSLLRMSYAYKLNVDDNESQSVEIEIALFVDERGNLVITTGEADPGKNISGSTIMFNIPNEVLWNQSSDGSYTVSGNEDTTAWSNMVVEGDLDLSFDIQFQGPNGEGAIIIYGNGSSLSDEQLFFGFGPINSKIMAGTPYDSRFLDDLWMTDVDINKKHPVTIRIVNRKASLFFDGIEILSAMIPEDINTSGKIGIYKYHGDTGMNDNGAIYSNFRLTASSIVEP